ncbi:MAG: YigZ family protein, partial [Bacteroidota bacterium]|nr:YigZ family protein [Bacteroidota bacterium]
YRLQFDYTAMNEIMTLVKQYNCSIRQQEIQLFCSMTIGVPINRTEAVLNRLKDHRSIDIVRIMC